MKPMVSLPYKPKKVFINDRLNRTVHYGQPHGRTKRETFDANDTTTRWIIALIVIAALVVFVYYGV